MGFLSTEQLYSKGAIKVDLLELANQSDFIVILCNLNQTTQGMIDKTFFSNMKENGYVVNMSRGSVLNEKDLEYALEKRVISGAGLDVTDQEPLSIESKLLSHDNVILTPHALCWTDECFHDIACEAIDSIIDFVDKKPIINQVNR